MDRTLASKRWRSAAVLAGIVGGAASTYLLVEYVTGQPGVCLTGSGCDLVRASAYAYPLGVPMPLIGLGFYVVAIWLTIWGVDARPLMRAWPGVVLAGFAAAGAIASILLTGLEAFVIKAFCSWCVLQSAASIALLLAAVMVMRTNAEPMDAHSSRTRQKAVRARAGERSRLLRTARAGGLVAAVAVAALLAAGATNGEPSGSADPSGLAPAGSPRLGKGAVEVVEFADFQCPGCAALAPIIANLASSDAMTLVSRYFPLDSIHANADRSARAAAAADQQGSFWQMSAALYARQNAWKDLSAADADAFFMTLAGELGLDPAAWQAAYESAETEAIVQVDRQAADRLGLSRTPTLFIGGALYEGPLSADGIRAAVAAAS